LVVGNINTLMEEKGKQKKLPEERYDKKLFKQAVKAAQEAKRIEDVKRRRKRLGKSILVFVGVLTVGFIVYLVIPIFKPKSEFTTSQSLPNYLLYSSINGEVLNGFVEKDISVDSLKAQSVLVFNPSSGDILFEKNAYEKKSIASLTKLLSAIVTIENFNLEDTVTVNLENIPQGTTLQLGAKSGDKITVENILKAMLISSYNDSAYIIANAYPYGGYDGFIKAMNRKAAMLNMKNSHFSNPAGLDQEDNYSTAYDVGILASVSRRYPIILDMVQRRKDTVRWNSDSGLVSTEVLTTNKLFEDVKNVYGLKTGNTDLAGQCFVGYFKYSNQKELVTVILNSSDRFGDTKVLEGYTRSLLKW